MLTTLLTSVPSTTRPLMTGVDVSRFQHRPREWSRHAGRIGWAAVKVTELAPGDDKIVNPDAPADWHWLHRHGKGRIAYLFGHPGSSPARTVAFFLHEVHRLGLRPRDGVALDLEVTDGKHPAAVDGWALAVLDELAGRLGRQPLLYTYPRFARNCARLGRYPLWISDPERRAGHPRVPRPWPSWAIHQYHVTAPIDRDVANYRNLDAMFDALGRS